VQGQAHHRARALRTGPRQFRRLGRGQVARRPRVGRAGRGGRGSLHCGARRFLCLGRKQPRQAGTIQPVAGDGVRPDPAARAGRGKDAGQERGAERHARLWARLRRRPLQSESVAAPPDGRRGGGTLPQAGFARIRCRLRQGGRALAEPRLSPIAIRLSFPRGDRARAGEPSSLGDARELDLLRRHGGRRPVARHGAARGRERDPGRQGPCPARPIERAPLPRRPLARRNLCAAGLHLRQDTDFRATDRQELVSAAGAQACNRRRADVDRRQRRGLRRARGLCLDRRARRPRADRRPGRKVRASARRCRASTSTCWIIA